MTTPEFDEFGLPPMPKTYTGRTVQSGFAKFNDGAGSISGDNGPSLPMDGVIMATMTTRTQGRPGIYATGGPYSYRHLTDFSGEPGSWTASVQVVAEQKNTVRVYPYWHAGQRHPADVGEPVTLVVYQMGEYGS